MTDVSKQEFIDLRQDVRDILSEIQGNPAYGRPSWSKRIDELEKEVETIKRFKVRILGYATGAAATGSVAAQFFFKFLF